MRRREFIAGLGSTAAWPMVARGQQSAVPVIGFLNSNSPEAAKEGVASFRTGLRDAGYTESQNVAVEFRWGNGKGLPVMRQLASDLVRLQVAVIVASGGLVSQLAAKEATTTIPIVMVGGADPVKYGLVASLNRPGGNITGMSWLGGSIVAAKRLELLHEAATAAAVIGVLINPTNPSTEVELKVLKETAAALGLRLHIANASTPREIDAAFAEFVQQRVGAVLLAADNFFFGRRDQLIVLAARHALPSISIWREFATRGGLMSYGANISDTYRQAAVYIGRILKGEKPTDLPVQQAVRIELVINLNTARALDISVPITLLARADEVIE